MNFTRLLLCWACVAMSSIGLGGPANGNHGSNDKVQVVGEFGERDHIINSESVITVSFPAAMVSASEIDVEAKSSPIRFEPVLPGKFIWKSQTEGQFQLGLVPPGKEFKIWLAAGLLDLDGKPVRVTESLGTQVSLPFSVDADFFGEKVDLRPSVCLHFNRTVRPADLVDTVWFQERTSRQRYPVEVIVTESEEKGALVQNATVTPRADLPGGKTFDLIVDGLKEAETGTRLAEVYVKALGETKALSVQKVAAFSYPMQRRRIAVEFSEPVDPAEGRKIKIEPEVKNLEVTAKYEAIWLQGDFELGQRYQVTVPASVTGTSGFAMASESRWGATFKPKKAALIFPTEDLHQRSTLGLNFAFMQVNAGSLQWKLAQVPTGKLLAIHKRLREFTQKQDDPVTEAEAVDPESGLPKWVPSELLIDACRLKTVAQGTIEASPADVDTRREIRWKPDTGLPSGAYVLEVTGKNAEGKTIANRAMITFTEYAVAQKESKGTRTLHVMSLADGHSVPQVHIRAVTEENKVLAEAVTDSDGIARFQQDQLRRKEGDDRYSKWFVLETKEGQMLQAVEASSYNSGYVYGTEKDDALRLAVTSDRPLYRPGQLLKLKGFAREKDAKGDLRIPHSGKVTWRIVGRKDDEVANGTAKLDDYGGFEAEWKIPTGIKVGQFQLSAMLGSATAQQYISIQEFRPPPFLVTLGDQNLPGAQAGIRISSAYFHGAANAGARVQWKAIWGGRNSGYSDVLVTDKPRLASAHREDQKSVSGEGVLGADGTLDVKCSQPFTDGIPRGWYDVSWTVEVTAVDGQTIAETAKFPVFAVPIRLSVNSRQVPRIAGSPIPPLAITVEAGADDPLLKPVADVPVAVEVYRVTNKSVKEQITEHVYRYRNSTAFEKESTVAGRTPLKKEIGVKAPGEYLVAVRHTDNKDVPVAAEQVFIAGPGDAEFPLRDEESIGVTCDKEGDEKGYVPGETAVLSVQAPFAGIAWVSVEAEAILDTFIVPLNGNAGRIEVPIKKEYGPNAWATVYLLRPGGTDKLPAERFGSVQLVVQRPDLQLKVEPLFAAKQVQPKDRVSGEIVVTCEGKPVADADLTVYAVDEAVLDAGDWHEPQLWKTMYPARRWNVRSYHGLERLSSSVETASLHQKGFILGDDMYKGGPQINTKDLRTDFPPMAYWETHLRSDRHGKVSFSFKAPDGLTKYRVIALAQTKQGQFGTGSDCVEVSKPVQIEPALPRFLRAGDEVELRAIVRQRIADEMAITVRCTTGLTLVGKNAQTQKVKRGLPAVYRFRATVGELTSVPIRLETEAGSSGFLGSKQPGDAVEITLPVHPPTLLRKEAIFAPLAEVQKEIPKDWTQANGSVDVTVSTSPWLPKLTGLPLLLDYPHGCFEQITSRILGYTVLGNFLAYLPEPAGREEAYRKRIVDGMERMNTALMPGGFLPYWPGGQASALPTVSGYWAVSQAASLGIPVPSHLQEKLAGAARAIALGEKNAPSSRCIRAYALMVLSEGGSAKVLGPSVREMYERREGLDEDGRAFLAMAMQRLGIMAQEKEQLLREIDRPLKERAFDPDTFSSTTRAEAIRALAFAMADPNGKTGKARDGLRQRVDELLDNSQSLSTQENFWLLLAFKAMHEQEQGPRVKFSATKPAPEAISRNGSSALWSNVDLRHIQQFAIRVDRNESLQCLMQAQYRSDSPATDRNDRGFRVERVVKNLTDNSRAGTAEAPFRLGDQILITYRVISPKLHHYVALEDELPAALETVNPSIASIARSYSVPQEKDARQLSLSYSELRDRTTCLYFNRVEPGIATYTVLARATCAGAFHWPATQVVPMYDSRFSGLSPSSVCYVSGE